jgi:hypothetical protein
MEGRNIVIGRIPPITNMQDCQNYNLMFYMEIIALAMYVFVTVFDYGFKKVAQ